MTAEGAKEYEALEAQAASLITLFTSKGYEHVAPSYIQPASLFLDRIGETRSIVRVDHDCSVSCDFRQRPAGAAYDGCAARHRLNDLQSETLVAGRLHNDVCLLVE